MTDDRIAMFCPNLLFEDEHDAQQAGGPDGHWIADGGVEGELRP